VTFTSWTGSPLPLWRPRRLCARSHGQVQEECSTRPQGGPAPSAILLSFLPRIQFLEQQPEGHGQCQEGPHSGKPIGDRPNLGRRQGAGRGHAGTLPSVEWADRRCPAKLLAIQAPRAPDFDLVLSAVSLPCSVNDAVNVLPCSTCAYLRGPLHMPVPTSTDSHCGGRLGPVGLADPSPLRDSDELAAGWICPGCLKA
jgi:hypothetical protein